MPLIVKAANDDRKIFDTVTLVAGKLRYETGMARSIFENRKKIRAQQGHHTTDAQLYAAFTGWNNGYVSIKERG